MKKILFVLFPCFLCCQTLLLRAQDKKPVTLNHIALYVNNLQTSTSFYMHIIGLDTMPEPFHDNRHSWFPIGGHAQLHIIQGAHEITQHDKNAHLCFTVGSVDEFAKNLAAAGIPYENWAGEKSATTLRVDGVKQIYFQDPDNYWVEINDDKY